MATTGVSDGWWTVWLSPFIRNPDGGTAFGARTSFDKAHAFPSLFTSMQKANPLVELIEQIVGEEVDKAYALRQADKTLALSDKRRKEFKKTFSDVFTEIDSLNIGRRPLNLEADATSPPPTAPTPAPAAPASAGTPAAPATGGQAVPATGTDPLAGAAPGAPGDPAATGADATGTDPAAEADTTGMAAGGGGGFGGFGGGGGGGGVGGNATGGAEGGEETPGEEEEDGAGEKEPVGDPIDAMVSGAQELLSQTQDPNLILKSLKGQIQTIFKEPEHALGMVKALYDTNDSILQSVAQRLYLFIKSSG